MKWHGGKSYLADKIISLMPDHTRYCEPFFGGGAVLFRKSCEGIAEFVNDIDLELTNFWRVLQSGFEEFNRILNCMPLSQVEFRESDNNSQDSIQKAVNFFVRYRQSRQALGKAYVTPTSRLRRRMNEQVSAWLSAVDSLPEAHSRLMRVEIWNTTALDFIDKLDLSDTLFYLDPPYLPETRQSNNDYKYEMTKFDHACLLAHLSDKVYGKWSREEHEILCELAEKKFLGKFLLSGYPSEMYKEIASGQGWNREVIQIDNKSSCKKIKDKKLECIWMNF